MKCQRVEGCPRPAGHEDPCNNYCWLGPLHLHTWNYEDTECLWCGPGKLSSKPGRWVDIGDGYNAWSVAPS